MSSNSLGQVFTKPWVADYMVSLITKNEDARVLDPCFGTGAFLVSLSKSGYTNVTGCEIDSELYNYATSSNKYNYKLLNSDFFEIPISEKFDCVILNPPYIRQERIDELTSFGITKVKLQTNPIFKGLSLRSNLYMYFIIKSIHHLQKNGEMIAIFPSNWLSANFGKAFETKIKELGAISVCTSAKGDIFEGSPDVDVLILKVVKNESYCKPIVYETIKNGIILDTNHANFDYSFKNQLCLSSVASTCRGLTTGCNKLFINPPVDNELTTPILSSPRYVMGYSTKDCKTDKLLNVSLINNDSTEYIMNVEKEILASDNLKTLKNKIMSGKKWYELKIPNSDGLLFSYIIRNETKFILNDRKVAVRDNFYIIRPKSDPLLMMSLLNNYYVYYQLEDKIKQYGSGLLKIQKYDIDAINIQNPEFITKEDRDQLIVLASELVDTGDRTIILKITNILGRYTNTTPEQIKKAYDILTERRLNN